MEAEDNLKYELKDSVEAKLLAWKKGKETNLRALLASLDTILWDDLIKDMGGKPDMAALITGGGVKKWYMKSVARVHPDKLNANNSTVEQRMIAGGVFGALNEAWLAFKHKLAFGISRPFISLTGDKFAIGTPRTRPRPAGHDGIANDWGATGGSLQEESVRYNLRDFCRLSATAGLSKRKSTFSEGETTVAPPFHLPAWIPAVLKAQWGRNPGDLSGPRERRAASSLSNSEEANMCCW
ncbi:hypothetical protein NMY22_g17612 [Coprinellus aureogranulatus]|nr:hypothetical protein NMY22_g17612 [Coprinellus aureogranulatus]